MSKKRPMVGVGVIIRKKGAVLLGKRKNSHGEGAWQFPGGHLEHFEPIFQCARREVLEETGLIIRNLKTGPYTNDFFEKEDKHYVTLFVVADWSSGIPKVLEPEKCEAWEWFTWPELTRPLFLPIINLIRQNFSPF
jgi:8-oxo-dGTP diphosphatase